MQTDQVATLLGEKLLHFPPQRTGVENETVTGGPRESCQDIINVKSTITSLQVPWKKN